ncbi:MAG: hypothetical protein ABWX57_11010 [Aeromicrobium sp.]
MAAPTGALKNAFEAADHDQRLPEAQLEGNLVMLWTILVILAIVALVLFILGRVRGGRGA